MPYINDYGYEHKFRPAPEVVAGEEPLMQTDEDGLKFIDLPKIRCTEENFSEYGRIFRTWEEYEKHKIDKTQWPSPNGRPILRGRGGGTTGSNPMIINWDEQERCLFKNTGLPKSDYILGFRKNGHIYTQDSNAHADGEQIFWPMEPKPFWCILTTTRDEATLKPSDFVAFWMDGTYGFSVYSHVNHNPLFPTNHNEVKLLTTQGKVHANIVFDSKLEFGCYWRIPDAFADPPKAEKLPARFNVPPYVKGMQLYSPASKPNIIMLKLNGGNRKSVTVTSEPNGEYKCEETIEGMKTSKGVDVQKLYCRPDGEMLIESKSGDGFVILLAKSNDNCEPKNEGLLGVRVLPGHALCLPARTWHSAPFTTNQDADNAAYKFTGNAIEAWMKIDILKECGQPLRLNGVICD